MRTLWVCLALVVAAVVVGVSATSVGVGAGVGVGTQRHQHAHGHVQGGQTAHKHKHKKQHLVDMRAPDLSRYHSAAQLFDEFRALSRSCAHVKVDAAAGSKKELVTVRVSNPATVARTDKLKVLLFFGEHARELISPETALRFTKLLCGVTPTGHSAPDASSLTRINRVLESADILLFPVINVDGHNRVVSGKYCTRTNARGVDLNRNWDDHWKRSTRADTNGGPHAFSEDEVRILRDVATDFNPDMFVSIHSGALGMYTPYAYSTARPSGPVEEEMVHILKRLNPSYCNCDVGAAGKQLNYLCPGTCLDYVFDKLKTPYAFAVEIWEGGYGYKRQLKTPRSPFIALIDQQAGHAHAHSHGHSHGRGHGHGHGHARRTKHTRAVAPHHHLAVSSADAAALKLGSCFLLKEQSEHTPLAPALIEADSKANANAEADADAGADTDAEADAEEEDAEDGEFQALDTLSSGVMFPPPKSRSAHTCLSSFNPTNSADYVAATDNWSHALVHMIERVLDSNHRAPKHDAASDEA